jgi:diadenosine tetraphosphate (Ap4A) HIT family hydrolase
MVGDEKVTGCPFCFLSASRIVDEAEHCVAIRDAFPVSEGHTLIISKRHVGSFFDLSESEVQDLFRLLARAKRALDAAFRPAGFNVGINDGRAAGQTVQHLHVHLIPRYTGDVPDPRGGIRWIFPERADYWSGR